MRAVQFITNMVGMVKPRRADPLPVRVRSLIAQQDRQSEIWIGYVQVGIALLFCTLYAIAPKPVDRMSDLLSPVPIAIATFLLFSLVRLAKIKRGAVSDWFVALSIVLDVGLLLAVIWSFHLQYGQPAAFSLKAPTFTYLFVFVAVRALRFDPKYVVASGLTAAFGWFLLTLAVIGASEPGTITRSFVAYINGNHVLIGAEFDKISVLLLVTAILALAVGQAKRTLAVATSEGATAREITRFLSHGVADDIRKSENLPVAGHAIERNAAIIMLDIRGFTALAMHRPAGEVVQLLTSFHALVVPLVRANGGVVDKFLGDGIMVTFGAVQSSDQAAADALRTLELIIPKCAAWEKSLADFNLATPLTVNAAVTYGAVVFATVGSVDRLEATVIGDAVNLAAKLEKHNKVVRSRVLAPACVVDASEAQGYAATLISGTIPRSAVAGVGQPLDLVFWS